MFLVFLYFCIFFFESNAHIIYDVFSVVQERFEYVDSRPIDIGTFLWDGEERSTTFQVNHSFLYCIFVQLSAVTQKKLTYNTFLQNAYRDEAKLLVHEKDTLLKRLIGIEHEGKEASYELDKLKDKCRKLKKVKNQKEIIFFNSHVTIMKTRECWTFWSDFSKIKYRFSKKFFLKNTGADLFPENFRVLEFHLNIC